MNSCAYIAVQVTPALKLPIISPAHSHIILGVPSEPFPHVCGRSRAGREVSALAHAGVTPALAPLHLSCALVAGEKEFWSAELEQFGQAIRP